MLPDHGYLLYILEHAHLPRLQILVGHVSARNWRYSQVGRPDWVEALRRASVVSPMNFYVS
jgi:hypothetical protein